MSLDIPRVEYIKDRKKGKDTTQKKQPRILKDDPSVRLNEQALLDARERRKNSEWKKIKLSDLNTKTNTGHNG